MNEKEEKKLKWHESGNIITSWIIVTILAAIILSQSFAVMGNGSLSVFSSVINHNTIYLLVLIYFVFLKTKVGKKYFNYFNVFLIFIYFIAALTSLLTVVQSFSLNTILSFIENFIILIYLFHTMFRDTHLWKEYHLGNSPFNELTNDFLFYAVLVVAVFTLVVNLISTVVVSGLFISVLDAAYFALLGRYIYLYREYLDYHQLNSDNEGNFDEVRKNIQTVLDATEIDEKIVEIADKVKDKTTDFIEESGIVSKKETKVESSPEKDTKKRGRKKNIEKGAQ